MRILVLTSTFPRWENDTEPEFILELCSFLKSNNIEIDVLAPHAFGAAKHEVLENIMVYRYQYFISKYQTLAYSGGIMANIRKGPIKIFQVPFFIFFQSFALFRRLRCNEYDLIHAHWIIPQGLISVVLKKITRKIMPKIIFTSHGGDLYALENIIFKKLKVWAINNCNDLCVVSNAMKQKALALGVAENIIHVMPMGVDFEYLFRPVQGIDRHEHQLLFVGRLVEKKGVDILIRAFAEVKKAVPGGKLLIAGDGPMRTELEMLTKSLGLAGNIEFLGSLNHRQLPKIYSSASVAVVPSIIAASGDQEGLGLVALEAMGCGCAVIASSLEAIRDVIDEKTGVLVTPGNVDELSRAIINLFNHPQQRMTLAGRGQEKARQLYSWEISGGKYLQLIQKYQKHTESGK